MRRSERFILYFDTVIRAAKPHQRHQLGLLGLGQVRNPLGQLVAGRIGGDRQHIEKIATRFDAVTYKHVLLPLWLMTYRHQGEEKQVVINAITGKVFGERPYSWVKILLAVLAVFFVFLMMVVFGRD